MRDRRASVRRSVRQCSAARSRRRGPRRRKNFCAAARLGALEHAVRLGVHDGAAAGRTEPADLLAARQGAGRIELSQRHDLHTRRARGLRPLGLSRQQGLGLRQRTALLQEIGGLLRRRVALSWRRRTACGVAHRSSKSADGSLHRCRAARRPCDQLRLLRTGIRSASA